MKRLLVVAVLLIAATMAPTIADAQGQGVYLQRAKSVITGGDFNSSAKAKGSATPNAAFAQDYTYFPLYTKKDTVTNTGADTVTQDLRGYYASVYTWVNVTSVSGTNTSCTVRLQACPDNVAWPGTLGDWKTLQTYTVSATGNPYDHTINLSSGSNGYNYRYLRWIFTGSGTHSSSWYGGLDVR